MAFVDTPNGDGVTGAWDYPIALMLGVGVAIFMWRVRAPVMAPAASLAFIGATLVLWPFVIVALGMVLDPFRNSDDGVGLVLITMGPVFVILGMATLIGAAILWRRERRRQRPVRAAHHAPP